MKMNRLTPILAVALLFTAAACWNALSADGKELWEKNCAKCHGPDGRGDTKMGKKLNLKDLTDAKVQAELTDDAAFKSIKEGVKDKDGKTVMKAVEGLSDDEIKGLVQYVRSFKK